MNGLEMILGSMGIDFGEIEKKIHEIIAVANAKLEKVDARLSRIEEALNIKGDVDDNGNE